MTLLPIRIVSWRLEHEKVRQTLVTLPLAGLLGLEQCADETIDRTVKRIEEVQRCFLSCAGLRAM
jgi:hypothetical protein